MAGSYSCEVSKKEYDECYPGRFLTSHSTDDRGDPFKSFSLLNLKFDTIGKYVVSFQTIMYCNSSECSNADDYIKVSARFLASDNAEEYLLGEVNLKNLKNKNQWEKKSSFLNINSEFEKEVVVSV